MRVVRRQGDDLDQGAVVEAASRREADGRAKGAGGAIESPLAAKHEAQGVVDLMQIGIEAQGLLKGENGVVPTLHDAEYDADIAMDGGVARLQAKRLAVGSQRAREIVSFGGVIRPVECLFGGVCGQGRTITCSVVDD